MVKYHRPLKSAVITKKSMNRYEEAILEYKEETEDGQYRLIYAYFGLAVYTAQCLEEAFSQMLWTNRIIKKDVKTNQEINAIIDLIENSRKTIGNFINDYEDCKKENRYIHNELLKLSFENDSFDLVLSSHFLFLYSEHFDLQFHIDSILEMCQVSKKEVRIFPLHNLKNKKLEHLEPVLKILKDRSFETKIRTTNYEFQKVQMRC